MSRIPSYERQRTVKNGKSFPQYAKPTRLQNTWLCENNTLEMATEVLLPRQTKWRATGHSENTSARGRSGCPFAIPIRWINTPASFPDSPPPIILIETETDAGGVSIKQSPTSGYISSQSSSS